MTGSDLAAILAVGNLRELWINAYLGRGIVIGKSRQGQMVIIYWIMGRKEKSRNRIMCCDETEGRLYTEAADPSKLRGDPSLYIYNAMREFPLRGGGWGHVVSNGDQTDTVFDQYPSTLNLAECLQSVTYEPDPPIYTPRITGLYTPSAKSKIEFSVLRKSLWSEECERLHFVYPDVEPGYGFGLTTYSSDADPPPSWRGEPMILPIDGISVEEIAKEYWENLDPSNRVSLAVKIISNTGPSPIHIINRYTGVAAAAD